MIAYSILDNKNSDEEVRGLVEGGGQSGNEPETKPYMTAYLIEKMVKQYKSHFDAGYINGIFDNMGAQQ